MNAEQEDGLTGRLIRGLALGLSSSPEEEAALALLYRSWKRRFEEAQWLVGTPLLLRGGGGFGHKSAGLLAF